MKHGYGGNRGHGHCGLKRAINWFDAVDLGVGLPLAWQETNVWTLGGYPSRLADDLRPSLSRSHDGSSPP